MNNKQRRQKAATGFYSIKRLRQHLFRSNCFTVWPDKIAAINRTSRAEVEAKLTDLKQKIHQLRVLPDEQELSVSVGAAIYDGLAHTSYEDLGGLADRQLYKAKCNGRDGFAIE
jgi:GGDEF domain-containing protein